MRGPRHSRVSLYASPVRYVAHGPGLLPRTALVLAADRARQGPVPGGVGTPSGRAFADVTPIRTKELAADVRLQRRCLHQGQR